MAAIILFCAASSHADTISYLRFEENTGTIAHDETGLMDGEMLGIWGGSEGWSTDVPINTIPHTGEANTSSIRFGGGSEYIDLSNYNDLLLGYSFTVEMFIKPETPNISVLFGFSPGASLGLLVSESLGNYYFNLNFMGDMPYAIAAGLIIDEWQHIALVKEPGEYSIYLDGVQVVHDTLAPSTDGPYDFAGNGTIGSRTLGGPTGTWYGWLDEVRISDEALMPSQFLNASIPEPATTSLLFTGLMALSLRSRKQKRRTSGSRVPATKCRVP